MRRLLTIFIVYLRKQFCPQRLVGLLAWDSTWTWWTYLSRSLNKSRTLKPTNGVVSGSLTVQSLSFFNESVQICKLGRLVMFLPIVKPEYSFVGVISKLARRHLLNHKLYSYYWSIPNDEVAAYFSCRIVRRLRTFSRKNIYARCESVAAEPRHNRLINWRPGPWRSSIAWSYFSIQSDTYLWCCKRPRNIPYEAVREIFFPKTGQVLVIKSRLISRC